MRTVIASYRKKDFRVDTFCTGGPGGQNQNKNQDGVRITCIPLNLSCESREFKSQRQNKKAAFRKLSQKILEHHKELEKKEKIRNTETVRTYHAVENRVKDHRTGTQMLYTDVIDDPTAMIHKVNRELLDQ